MSSIINGQYLETGALGQYLETGALGQYLETGALGQYLETGALGQYFLYLKRQCNETVWTFFFIESNSTQNLTLSKDSIDTAKNLHQTFNIVAKMSILKLKFKPELPLGRDSLNSP